MKLMKINARLRNAFPNKNNRTTAVDEIGRAVAVNKQVHGSDVRAATSQSHSVKGVSVLKAVGRASS